MKHIIPKLMFVLALLIIPFAAACTSSTPATGTVTLSIADAAADMGAISKIEMTVDSIRVRSQSGDWTTVSTDPQTFDLLQLREMNTSRLMVQTELQTRTYNMVELNVSKVTVTNGSGTHDANLINNRLQIECMLEVQTATMTTANFDFIANESLHTTTDGQYVFAPVIAVQTRTRAEVQIRTNNEVDISGGTIRTNAEVGMNIDGQIGEGLKIQTNVMLNISDGKVVQSGGQSGNQSGGQDDGQGGNQSQGGK